MKKHILSAVAILVIGLAISSCSDYLSVERFFKDRQSEEKIFKSKNFTEHTRTTKSSPHSRMPFS